MPNTSLGSLDGLRVVEVGDEQAEYCGLVLAGLGAEVIKVEPPDGSPSRRRAPYFGDEPDPDGSLHFWNYNRGKRSVVLDTETEDGTRRLRELIASADVLLQSGRPRDLDARGLAPSALLEERPTLVVARMTPFGDEGPWVDFLASDLVHLALGGVIDNCGYDPDPSGHYDLPPIAPQYWHSYHIAGDQLAAGILAALMFRLRTGLGQYVSCAVHEAVAKNTELDVPSWVMRRLPFHRQTCQHAAEVCYRIPSIAATKDGRWVMARWQDEAQLREFLERYGMAADLEKLEQEERAAKDPAAPSSVGRAIPGIPVDARMSDLVAHRAGVVGRFIGAFTYDHVPWREAQDAGHMFAPLRKPHENAVDEHWLVRGTYTDIEHPELGRSFRYATSRWISTATSWVAGRRAPRLGEDSAWLAEDTPRTAVFTTPRVVVGAAGENSARGKPFALDGVRILDFSWFLASAGGTRILSAYGAQAIKVEWKANPDTRFGAQAPIGGRAARDAATEPLPPNLDAEMGGQFNNKNPGKRGLSLNVRHPEGLEIARRLVALSDVVAEGFSPGVMERWGLGYESLRAIKPDIIYAQQSGAGHHGTYGRFRAVGPIAQAVVGMCEMSGLPEPAAPAGWGYSYLDWVGAYSFATAILAALYHRAQTGEGQWIDASQCEAGIFLNGVATLDWSANDREWQRSGNRSPYQPVAPHGVYPCLGVDRWVAIACADDQQWKALAIAAGHPEWLEDDRFADLDRRVAHQDALDHLVSAWTRETDAYDAMEALQRAGVPAGVSQTAADRCDRDPQLRALDWLTEVTGTKIGRWPIAELPVDLSESPPYIGGRIDRGAPYYGEDNEYVLGELLGMSTREIRRLAEENVI